MGLSHPLGSSDLLLTPWPEVWDPLAGFTWEGLIEPASSGLSSLAYEPESLSSAQPSSSPAFEATNREARKLLGDCLDVQIDPDNPEYVSQISSHLDDLGVRRSGQELVQHTETLSSGTSAGDIGLYLLRYAIYLASNNLLCLSKVDKLLEWIIRSGRLSTVERLIDTKTPSVEIFAVKLLVSAARLGEFDVARTLTTKGIDVDSFAVAWGVKTTALEEAVQKRNAVLVRLLLDAGANPSTHDNSCDDGRTALRTAITGPSRSLEIAEMLIGCGADVNTHTSHFGERWTLLNDVVSDGNIDAVRCCWGPAHVSTMQEAKPHFRSQHCATMSKWSRSFSTPVRMSIVRLARRTQTTAGRPPGKVGVAFSRHRFRAPCPKTTSKSPRFFWRLALMSTDSQQRVSLNGRVSLAAMRAS